MELTPRPFFQCVFFNYYYYYYYYFNLLLLYDENEHTIHDTENQCVFCFHGIHGVIVNMTILHYYSIVNFHL